MNGVPVDLEGTHLASRAHTAGGGAPAVRRAAERALRRLATFPAALDRHPAAAWSAVVATALLTRILALAGLRASVYRDFLLWDERTYDTWARQLLDGPPHFVYSLSVVHGSALGLLYRIAGPDILFARWMSIVFGVLTCCGIVAIGKRLAGSAVGFAAGLLAAVYKPFVLFSVTLLKEPLGLLLFAAVIWLYLAQDDDGARPWKLFFFGLLGALLTGVRQNAVVCVVVLGAVLMVKVWRVRGRVAGAVALASLAVGCSVAAVPLGIVNQRGTGRFSPLLLGGFDLYLGNHLAAQRPYYSPVQFASTNPDTQGEEFTVEASRRAGRALSQAEASDYWTGEILRAARTQPLRFARHLGAKALAAVHRFEEGDNHSLDFLAAVVPFFGWPLPCYWLVMPLGMAGLIWSSRSDARSRVLLLALLAYGASMVAVFPNMRIRSPLLVLLIPYAIVAVRELLQPGGGARACGGPGAVQGDGRRARPVLVTLALAFAALESVPVPGVGDLSGHYNTHAIALSVAGRPREADDFWRASSQLRGSWSPYADLALARMALQAGHVAEARTWLERIPDDSFAASNKLELLGDVLLAQGSSEQASAAYRRAVQINPNSTASRRVGQVQ